MQENKNVVEEAFIQMKQVENAIAENAKGILQSTMKEEISQLVKESLSEQEELDLDTDIESDEDEMEVDNEDDAEMDINMDIDMEADSDEPIDLRGASDEEILKVFKAMGEEDGIIVKKDGEDIHLTDNDTDSEYLVKLGESEENEETMEQHEQVSDQDVEDVIAAIFSQDSLEEDMEEEMDEEWGGKKGDDSKSHKDYMDEQDDEEMDEQEEEEDEEDEEVVYEIEFNEEDEEEELDEQEEEMDEQEEEMDEEEEDESYDVHESYNHKKSKKGEHKEGKKMSVKPKGLGIGKGPKFDYKKEKGGFKEDKKEAPKAMGTGKAKFSYKEGENLEGKMKPVKKSETKEAARTIGMGSKEGRGLRKGITNNRNYVYKNGVTVESLESEVGLLREKNDEYRKALNVFREKLNEVAIFNSNLAYATRLFTEHSTTKKEKINILRRFDGVESLKDSKNLYRQIKEELSKTETKSINETVGNKIVNTASTGSATTLIESKTYENPQFMRIKDLISKLN